MRTETYERIAEAIQNGLTVIVEPMMDGETYVLVIKDVGPEIYFEETVENLGGLNTL